jgi:hypothetical protein
MQDADTVVFRATVVDAGGGYVELLIDRDAPHYPPIGARVEVRLIDGRIVDHSDRGTTNNG